jgi:type II secretory pathway pseudopilin PulG
VKKVAEEIQKILSGKLLIQSAFQERGGKAIFFAIAHLFLFLKTKGMKSTSPHSQSQRNYAEAGLSLLECLMAILMVGLTGAMIAPPLLISTATRVQNHRVEQALQLAQAELDRTQVLVSRGEHTLEKLPDSVSVSDLNIVPGPTTVSDLMASVNASCNTHKDAILSAGTAKRIDVDGDCQTDFLVQVYRSRGNFSLRELRLRDEAKPTDFQMMVRIYSYVAEENLGELATDPVSLKLQSGVLSSQKTRPLAVLTANMVWSEQSFSLCSYHNATTCNSN